MKFTIACLSVLLFCGCAKTSIERGAAGFVYESDKDIAIEGLDWSRRATDGSEIEHLHIDKAGGSASSVEAARWGAMNELIKRIPVITP